MDTPGAAPIRLTPSAPAAPARRMPDACRRFLKSLGATVKLISLYQEGHPVAASATQQTWHELQEIFAETGWKDLALSLVEGRWLVNGASVADAADYELLALAFRAHALTSVTFLPQTRLSEVAVLCELASTPPNRLYETDAADFMKERGVRHIRVNVEEFVRARRVKLPASSVIESPIPPAALKPAEGKGFGSFLKSLVDGAVQDMGERARLYAEAVQLVKGAIERHVAEATRGLAGEKRQAVHERARTEHVLARVADGKVIVDKEGRVLMMDPVAEEIAGKQFKALAGKPLLENVGAGEQMVALTKDLVLPKEGELSGEVDLAGEKEVIDAFRQSLALVQDEHGRLIGTYAVLPYIAKFREAMRLQEQFVSSITHDLKAPLTSICAALEIISQSAGPKMDPEEARFLDISLRNSRVLRQMISEILDFSKLRQGKMSVRPAPCPVEPILRESVEALGPWAQTKKISLGIKDCPGLGSLPPVLADHGRVVQILNNLISNAIKSTDEGGSVTVCAREGEGDDAGMLVLCVCDTGCGIAPADQARIFEKFTQLSDGHRREGVGLGLTIVKELVALHMGRLWLESEVGQGSKFFFSLPTAAKKGPDGDGNGEKS